MTLYRSKPTEIEAVQWTGDNFEDVKQFAEPDGVERVRLSVGVDPAGTEDQEPFYVLHLLAGKDGAQGFVPVPVMHWVVRQPGDLSDHWPVEPPYFAGKYDEILEGSDQHAEYLGRLMDVIREGEALDVVSAVCDTHDGIEWTEAELHDRHVHGIDRCVPAFRVIADEHRVPVGCDDPDAGCAGSMRAG